MDRNGASVRTSDKNAVGGEVPSGPVALIGRQRELRIALDLVRSELVRMLTITGTGGIGKTSLALAIARELQSDTRVSVFQIPLAHLDNPGLVMAEIVQGLGLREGAGVSAIDRISAEIKNRDVVLILDNLEQVRAAGQDIATLLKHNAGLTILATSRIPLNITFEQQFALGPLPLPVSPNDSVELLRGVPSIALFTRSARVRRLDFELTEANAAAVAAICTRVDGIPLAIELAAARIKVLTPVALLARLDEGIEVLSGGPLDHPERLRTVRDAIQWSYGLLATEEQAVFAHLAVCKGGFTLDAAESIIAPAVTAPERVLDILEVLVECNLMQGIETEIGETRFSLYEPVREFGLGVLRETGEFEVCRERHADWYSGFLERAWNGYAFRIDTGLWFDRVEADLDNARYAIDWSLETGATERLLLMTGHLSPFWYSRGYLYEGQALLDLALEGSKPGSDRARAKALYGLGSIGHLLRDGRAVDLLSESLRLAERAGDRAVCCLAMFMIGMVAEASGDFANAEPCFADALNLSCELDLPGLTGDVTCHLGMVTWGRGDVDTGLALGEQALEIQTQLNELLGISLTSSFIGFAECARGNLDRAEALFQQSFEIRLGLENWINLANCLDNFGLLATAKGQWARAVRLFAAAAAIRDRFGQIFREPGRTQYLRAYEELKSKLSPQNWQRAWETGSAYSLEEAIQEARIGGAVVSQTERPDADSHGLSIRELEVLRLLVEGRSDREIGEELYISTRTAQGHVSHIFDKLGVNSRAAAVAIAVREGIAPSALN